MTTYDLSADDPSTTIFVIEQFKTKLHEEMQILDGLHSILTESGDYYYDWLQYGGRTEVESEQDCDEQYRNKVWDEYQTTLGQTEDLVKELQGFEKGLQDVCNEFSEEAKRKEEEQEREEEEDG